MMQSGDLDLRFGPAPEARPEPNQQGNQNARHGPPSLSVHAGKLNLFNADGVYDRHTLSGKTGADQLADGKYQVKRKSGTPPMAEVVLALNVAHFFENLEHNNNPEIRVHEVLCPPTQAG